MDEKQFKRVFSQIKPAPGREEAMLAALLTPERKVSPMKKMKKTAAVLTAAALLLMTCAFTVMTDLDQRLLEFLGVRVENTELLSPVAQPVDVEVTDNGATLNVRQVLMDRTAILFQLDFTAPEDVPLPQDDAAYHFSNPTGEFPHLVTKGGDLIPCELSYSGWGELADEDPTDNRISMSCMVHLSDLNGVDPFGSDIQSLWFPAVDLVHDPVQTPVLSGNWSCQIPLTGTTDPGWMQNTEATYDHALLDLTIHEIYLSPMMLNISIHLSGETPWDEPVIMGQENPEYEAWTWLFAEVGSEKVVLTSPDGRSVALQLSHSRKTEDTALQLSFLPAAIIDPAEFCGGTLTIGARTFSLSDLAPASAD